MTSTFEFDLKITMPNIERWQIT